MAVNLRSFPVEIMEGVTKRRFDGADRFEMVDEENAPHSLAWPF